jgi:ABC-2 type transport system permease protein/oleandomycin transport system permease protein
MSPTAAATATTDTDTGGGPGSGSSRRLWREAGLLTGRHLIETSRTPDVVVYTVVVPILLMLLVNYGFGGAIAPGGDYIQDLLPAIFVLAAGEIGFTTAAGTATDLNTGLVDRFRSLPIARTALPLGRTMSDTIRHLLAIAVLTAVGYALGFRFDSPAGAAATVGVALAFGFALTWLAVCLGAGVGNAETAASASLLLLLLPLFASSALVPVATMPGWLQAIARNSPHTAAIDAMRALSNGGAVTADLWHTAAWTAGLLLVAIPLATHLYRRAT